MAPLDHPHLPAVLRLFTAEAMPFYIFYASFLDMLTNLGAFIHLWSMAKNTLQDQRPGYLNYCVMNDMWSAAFSLSQELEGECITMKKNRLGFFNLGCVLICMLGVGYQAWIMMIQGNWDVCSGRYFAAKWNAQQQPFYKLIALIMGTYLLVSLIAAFCMYGVFDLQDQWHRTEIVDFFFYKISTVFIVVVNAFILTLQSVPEFEYDNEEFHNVRFHRTWKEIITQPSSQFLDNLQSALLHAHAGTNSPLEKLLEEPEDADRLLRACTIEVDSSDEDLAGRLTNSMKEMVKGS